MLTAGFSVTNHWVKSPDTTSNVSDRRLIHNKRYKDKGSNIMQLKQSKPSKGLYAFHWSPEGRHLATYFGTLRECRAQFKREFPQYARFMGEVYITEAVL